MEEPNIVTAAEAYDERAETYEESYDAPYWQLYHEISWRSTIEALRIDPSGARVLDAGGGTGWFARRLARLGCHVVVTDLAPNMLAVARRKAEEDGLSDRIQTELGDICDMGALAGDGFDLVIAQGDPLSYCAEPAAAARELARCAKPGARIVVSVDHASPFAARLLGEGELEELDELLQSGTGWMKSEGTWFKAHFFTPQTLTSLLDGAGLRVERVIGKTVLAAGGLRAEALGRDEVWRRALELELRHNANPNLLGRAGHIEATAVKGG